MPPPHDHEDHSDLEHHHHGDAVDGHDHDHDGRWAADERLWQFKPIRVEVDADRFVGVQPFLPSGIRVNKQGDAFVIEGEYGLDLFPNHRFEILIDGELRVFTRVADIPEQIDNVIGFHPDDTHDITLTYTFEKGGKPFTHTQWIHHDMDPWIPALQELLARETNGGWNARSDPLRRRRHHALHADDAHDVLPQRVREQEAGLETG